MCQFMMEILSGVKGVLGLNTVGMIAEDHIPPTLETEPEGKPKRP